jgi:uncharacterized OB-fold protein
MSEPLVVTGPHAEPELPPMDAVTQGWWDATRERRLVVQQCAACGHLQHYPRALCTACGGTALGWVDVAGDGVVDAFTVVHRGLPGYDAPYVVARVRLAEGPILLTNLVGDAPDAWSCEQSVQVAWQPLADGRHLPVFVASAR